MIDITQAASCLTMIFDKSLAQGKSPLEWKSANITLIHKSGATDSVKNYRPISLTIIPCKILEHIVLRNLLAKVDKPLHKRHHGFRRGLSCETQLCATLNDILNSVDRHKSAYAAVLDFSKAFDRVPHTLLMEKLSMIEEIDDTCWNEYTASSMSDHNESFSMNLNPAPFRSHLEPHRVLSLDQCCF